MSWRRYWFIGVGVLVHPGSGKDFGDNFYTYFELEDDRKTRKGPYYSGPTLNKLTRTFDVFYRNGEVDRVIYDPPPGIDKGDGQIRPRRYEALSLAENSFCASRYPRRN
jgi:hypothetical protein